MFENNNHYLSEIKWKMCNLELVRSTCATDYKMAIMAYLYLKGISSTPFYHKNEKEFYRCLHKVFPCVGAYLHGTKLYNPDFSKAYREIPEWERWHRIWKILVGSKLRILYQYLDHNPKQLSLT